MGWKKGKYFWNNEAKEKKDTREIINVKSIE